MIFKLTNNPSNPPAFSTSFLLLICIFTPLTVVPIDVDADDDASDVAPAKALGKATCQSALVVLGLHVLLVLCNDLGTLLPVVLDGMGKIAGFVDRERMFRIADPEIVALGDMVEGIVRSGGGGGGGSVVLRW